jgi:hypothetical protein
MTDQEAERLTAGQKVEVRCHGRWAPAVVVGVVPGLTGAYPTTVRLRRTDTRPDGSPFKTGRRKWPHCVRAVPGFHPLPANVYADYLSERGEERAARILREAFPLDDGTG